MRTLILFILGLTIGAHAQTATNLNLRVIVRFDDPLTLPQTNVVNISGTRLQGIVAAHAANTDTRRKAKLAPLTLGQFVVQEIGDKGIEWEREGALAELKGAGWTNTTVQPSQKLLERWATLNARQQAAAVDYLNSIAE